MTPVMNKRYWYLLMIFTSMVGNKVIITETTTTLMINFSQLWTFPGVITPSEWQRVMTWKCFPHYWSFMRGVHRHSDADLAHTSLHDDVIEWKHFPRYWPPANSPHKGQWRGALMSSRTNDWVNTRDAGDLRRHRAHYGVTVMVKGSLFYLGPTKPSTTA